MLAGTRLTLLPTRCWPKIEVMGWQEMSEQDGCSFTGFYLSLYRCLFVHLFGCNQILQVEFLNLEYLCKYDDNNMNW